MARLLVTNCTPDTGDGGVYLLDTSSGAVDRILDHPSRGLTRGPGGIYVAGNHGQIFHVDPDSRTATLRKETGLRGTHDLRSIDRRFFLVASVGNWVLEVDSDLEIVDRMQIVQDSGDICHANCLIRAGGD